MDTAGWQAVKEARSLVRAGAVIECAFDGKLLKGAVIRRGKPALAGLMIASKTDVTNLCRCPHARREGAMCACSVAVGLQYLVSGEKKAAAGTPAEASTGRAAGEAGKPERSRSEAGQTGGAANESQSFPGKPFIRVEFPRDFMEKWEKGRLPVRLGLLEEDQASGSPDSIGENGEDSSAKASLEGSRRLRAWLAEMGQKGGAVPPFIVLTQAQATAFLKALKGHPHVWLGGREVDVIDQPVRLKLDLAETGEPGESDASSSSNSFANATIQLNLAGTLQRADSGKVLLWAAGEGGRKGTLAGCPWLLDIERGAFLPVLTPVSGVMDENEVRALYTPGKELRRDWRWLAAHLHVLNECFELNTENLRHLPRILPGKPEFELSMEGSLNHVAAQLTIVYPGCRFQAGSRDTPERAAAFPYQDPEDPARFLQRNLSAEKTALNALTSAGFRPPNEEGTLSLNGEAQVLRFYVSLLPKLRAEWKRVTLGERFQHVTARVEPIRPEMTGVAAPGTLGSGEDWFSCQFDYRSEAGDNLSQDEVRRMLATGRSRVPLRDGRIGVLDLDACQDLDEVLRDCDPVQEGQGAYRIRAAQKGYLDLTLGASEPEGFAGLKEGKGAVGGITSEELDAALGELGKLLRPYQRDGIQWLYRHAADISYRGGILADEMGLGKTLQSLATLKCLWARQPKDQRKPALIVCPTSLTDNWQAEARKFVPEFKVLIMRGPHRHGHFQNLRFADLVITSYALLIRDIDDYREQEFSAVFLDEASYIKNPDTQNSKSVRKLHAGARFALTGTPIENSVRDLWSIMEFVSPGYMGGKEEFRVRYELPIRSENAAPEVHERLRRRLAPFLLRRTKRIVTKDLPDKLEEIIYCELSDTQKTLYNRLLSASRKKILESVSQGNDTQARANMLTALLRLRQVCCDPRLVREDEPQDGNSGAKKPASQSSKLELLQESLQEAIEGGHRVLVFSQFVGMLKYIRQLLEAQGWDYCYLDGSSTDRADQVKTFQTRSDIPVFLISLKAGGYGLTLTKADTVIHFDPWWNPAVEAQATDRAHRIGQENVVTSYKLIARDTVEEKILNLQQKKRDVFDAAIDDQRPMMNGLTTDDLKAVLEV